MAITGVTDYTNIYGANRANKSGGDTGTTGSYLQGLKEKYPDVNVTVADFKNEKQEDNYMFGCSGGNNIVIAPNIIEKMARDPATAAKYEKYIAEAPEATEIMREGIAAHGGEMVACGTAIDENGKVTYWSIGRHKPPRESQSVSYKEQLEEKREKKRQEEAIKEKRLKKAETMEKLLEKIRNRTSGNESAADGTIRETGKGEQIDLSV